MSCLHATTTMKIGLTGAPVLRLIFGKIWSQDEKERD